MKKKGLFILLGLICIAVVGGSGALFVTRDKTGPKIIVSEDRKIAYNTDSDKTVLLDGVTAIDEKDGDVSDSLRVESVRNNEDGSLEVTYSAVDDSRNVTKLTCKVETLNQENSGEDAQEEKTEASEENQEENLEENQENTQQDFLAQRHGKRTGGNRSRNADRSWRFWNRRYESWKMKKSSGRTGKRS